MPIESILSLPKTRGLTDASCEMNGGKKMRGAYNCRLISFAALVTCRVFPTTRVFLSYEIIFLYTSLRRLVPPSLIIRERNTRTQTNSRTACTRTDALSLSGALSRADSRTHVQRTCNTHSINTCNEIYFKPT